MARPNLLVVGDVGPTLDARLGEVFDVTAARDPSMVGPKQRKAAQVVVVVAGADSDVSNLIENLRDGTPVALAVPRATLAVISSYYLRYPQIAPLIELEGLTASGAAEHARQLLARAEAVGTAHAENDLVFGTYFSVPASAADYRDQRSLSLISPSMQGFLDDLRDAVTVMSRPVSEDPDPMSGQLVIPPIPWDPFERSDGMQNPAAWTRIPRGGRRPNLHSVLDNAGDKFAQALLRNDGSPTSEDDIRAFDKPPHLLILGDSGTGKTMVARLVKDLFDDESGSAARPADARGSMPFVEINCGGMTITNFDHRMHGSVEGTYTQAHNVGQLARAAYGVAFFDELGDLSYEAQSRLLMYLEDGRVTPEGALPFFGFTRVIAATNRDLGQLIREHRFRHDLLARFGKRVRLPSLAERGLDDLERLVDFVGLNPAVNPTGQARFVSRISREAVDRIKSHSFSDGNFRELESVVHRAVEKARRRRSTRVEIKDIELTDPDFDPTGPQHVRMRSMPANGQRPRGPAKHRRART